MNNEPRHFVYVVAAQDETLGYPVKIGRSSGRHFRERFGNLKQGFWFKAYLPHVFEFTKRKHCIDIERAAHEALKVHRWCGEWFDMSHHAAGAHIASIVRERSMERVVLNHYVRTINPITGEEIRTDGLLHSRHRDERPSRLPRQGSLFGPEGY